jgi:radical SAM protein with 4Fe4S-binding SPASM domain
LISVSRLLCDTISPGDSLRYGDSSSRVHGIRSRGNGSPVVVWNCIRQCNLRCIHCYASATDVIGPPQMSTSDGENFIQGLSEFGVPVILFSGGEPMLRKDLFHLAGYALKAGIRVAVSTNGTLIDDIAAEKLKQTGFAEVGISLDGIGANNDRFRGHRGAFEEALAGIMRCIARDIRVSLRLTLTRFNRGEIPAIFKLVEDERISRVCFYHLAYSGRGDNLRGQDLSHAQTREAVDTICAHTVDLHRRGKAKEILTVGNHADAVYLYLKLREADPGRAEKALTLLRMNGGNNSGVRIGAVDDTGNVHPDQFWWHHTLGNVRERKFGDIWMDTSDAILKGLKDRKSLLKGRCGRCRYLDLCNGNLRVRAEAIYGDVWAEDPACYLTDQEIGIA